MSKKYLLALAIVFIALICSQTISGGINYATAAPAPTQLKIYMGPPSVPAENSEYDSIFFVQLADSQGNPARATSDTVISVSSSRTDIGTVEPTITIPAGATYASGKFHSTFTPGATTITATSSGYATVQATLNTIGPIPSTLAVYAFPPTLPSDGNIYPAIVVQLQDAGGAPARAHSKG